MKLKTIKEIEDYIEEKLEIPFVDIDGYDVGICNEIVIALKEILRHFPKMKNVICTVGSEEYIAKQIETLGGEMPIEPALMSMIYSPGNGYMALLLPPELKEVNLEEAQAFLEELFENEEISFVEFTGTIYHEWAHILDVIFDISASADFAKIVEKYNLRQLAKAGEGAHSNFELFGDIVVDYFLNSNPGEGIKEVIDLIYDQYNKVENSNSFNLSKRFKGIL